MEAVTDGMPAPDSYPPTVIGFPTISLSEILFFHYLIQTYLSSFLLSLPDEIIIYRIFQKIILKKLRTYLSIPVFQSTDQKSGAQNTICDILNLN